MKNPLVFALTLAVLLGSSAPAATAQDVSGSGSSEKRDAYTVSLAFSKDGKTLHEIRMESPASLGQFRNVRAITRDASTGKIRHVFDLGPDTEFFSATTDGRTAVISENRNRDEKPVRLFLFDIETGRTRDLPSAWFDPENHLPDPAISRNGQLVSIHSDSGSADAPRVVTVYNWRTRRLVAQQATGFSAGGFDGGGVTVDGKIEFTNNRNGTEIVDPKTGQSLLVYGPNSVRSPDGAWVVELAGYVHAGERLETIVINGSNGKILGKLDLDLRVSDDEPVWSWSGTFCGTSGRFVAWNPDSVLVFDIHSLKQIAAVPFETWRDKNQGKSSHWPVNSVACDWEGKRVAIRSGARLTLQDLE